MQKDKYFQYVRAICIIFVIMIHIPPVPDGAFFDYWLSFRQVVNFPVAVFFFLSGYFISIEKYSTPIQFYKNKLVRLVPPYLIWSLFYVGITIVGGNIKFSILDILDIVFLGGASAPFYYISVLMQLVLITPIINMLFKHKKYNIVYSITPIYLIFIYWYTIHVGYMPCLLKLFPAWIVFFSLGIQARNNGLNWVKKVSILSIIFFILIALVLSILESQVIFNLTKNSSFAASQIKFSSFLYAFSLILLLLKLRTKISKNNKLLLEIGEFSFGIYFVHILFIRLVLVGIRHIYNFEKMNYLVFQLICLIMVLFCSLCFCKLLNNLFYKDKTKLLGLR